MPRVTHRARHRRGSDGSSRSANLRSLPRRAHVASRQAVPARPGPAPMTTAREYAVGGTIVLRRSPSQSAAGAGAYRALSWQRRLTACTGQGRTNRRSTPSSTAARHRPGEPPAAPAAVADRALRHQRCHAWWCTPTRRPWRPVAAPRTPVVVGLGDRCCLRDRRRLPAAAPPELSTEATLPPARRAPGPLTLRSEIGGAPRWQLAGPLTRLGADDRGTGMEQPCSEPSTGQAPATARAATRS